MSYLFSPAVRTTLDYIWRTLFSHFSCVVYRKGSTPGGSYGSTLLEPRNSLACPSRMKLSNRWRITSCVLSLHLPPLRTCYASSACNSTLPRNNSRSLPWKRRNAATTLWRTYTPLARSRLLRQGSSSTSTPTSSPPLSPILIVSPLHHTVLEQPLVMSPSTSLHTPIPYNFIMHTKPN